jgi:ribosome-binding factor A
MRTPRFFSACWQVTLLLCAEGLNQAAGFLRAGLFKRLHIHTVPTLHFVYDQTPERAADMNALIARAVASRAKDD